MLEVRRREFIAGLGGAATSWPLVAWAQRLEMPVIGLLQSGGPSSWDFTGFRQGLKDTGYVEGQCASAPPMPGSAIEPRVAEPKPAVLTPGALLRGPCCGLWLAADWRGWPNVRLPIPIAAFGPQAGLASSVPSDETARAVGGLGHEPVADGSVLS